MRRFLPHTVTLILLLIPIGVRGQPARVALEPCTLPGAEGEVRCGRYEVFENRQTRTGRIPLFIAILRAGEAPVEPDPLLAFRAFRRGTAGRTE